MTAPGAFVFQKSILANGTHEFNVDQKKVDQGKGGGLEGDLYVFGTFDSAEITIQAEAGNDNWVDTVTPITVASTTPLRVGPVNANKFRLEISDIVTASDLLVFFYSSQPIIDLTD